MTGWCIYVCKCTALVHAHTSPTGRLLPNNEDHMETIAEKNISAECDSTDLQLVVSNIPRPALDAINSSIFTATTASCLRLVN